VIESLTNVVNGTVQTRAFGVSLDEIGAIDSWVERVAASMGVNKRAVFSARLCIAELTANILEHGAARSDDDRIVITINRLGDGIGVELLDSREPFDPTAKLPIAKSDPSNCGGRGLVLLQAYADDLTYVHDGTYNRVKFKIKSD
jgi:anti-sigma regulatory factor (Ser/Thr protein kinase)